MLPNKSNPSNNTNQFDKPVNSNAGVTLREGCCPCLLENLDSTTSILLKIYNEDQSRRNKTVTNSQTTSLNTKSRRSVTNNAKNTKQKKRKSRTKRRKHPRKRDKRQKSLLSQLDICCLCNFLPEDDLSLLSATKTVENKNSQNDSLTTITTTQGTAVMTSNIFPDDITTIQETTTPSSSEGTTNDNVIDLDEFKDAATINILQGVP